MDLLSVLSGYWQRSIRTGSFAFTQFPKFYAECTQVTIRLGIRGFNAVSVPWTWQKYALIVPNWWHWRKPNDEKRWAQAVHSLAGSVATFLLLLVVRQLCTNRGNGCHNCLGMWARWLAMSAVPDPDISSWLSRGVLMLTSLLGMWNTMILCGALFEIRVGGIEWRPVFERSSDLKAYGSQLRISEKDYKFVKHIPELREKPKLGPDSKYVKRYIKKMPSLRSDLISVVEDGMEDSLRGWQNIHKTNGTPMYRKLHDFLFEIAIDALIAPMFLTNDLYKIGQCLNEAGIQRRLLALQDHWRRVESNALTQDTEYDFSRRVTYTETDEQLEFMVKLFGCFMMVSVIIWLGELSFQAIMDRSCR